MPLIFLSPITLLCSLICQCAQSLCPLICPLCPSVLHLMPFLHPLLCPSYALVMSLYPLLCPLLCLMTLSITPMSLLMLRHMPCICPLPMSHLMTLYVPLGPYYAPMLTPFALHMPLLWYPLIPVTKPLTMHPCLCISSHLIHSYVSYIPAYASKPYAMFHPYPLSCPSLCLICFLLCFFLLPPMRIPMLCLWHI